MQPEIEPTGLAETPFPLLLASLMSPEELEVLHQRCGIYTRRETVERLLDWIGWTTDADLGTERLLEPACGDGAFLIPAAERLLASGVWRGLDDLGPRIRAYELHPAAASRARSEIRLLLRARGFSAHEARQLARRWVRTGDFLLDCGSRACFTRIVANPPYLRWSRLPRRLAEAYERALPPASARGDLSLPFMDKMLAVAATGARLALLVSDRWIYSGYAERFRRLRSGEVEIVRWESVDARDVFQQRVSAYPALMLLEKHGSGASRGFSASCRAGRDVPAAMLSWLDRFGGMDQAGCAIRVGPALGHDPAFVLPPGPSTGIEHDRLARFVGPSEINKDRIEWNGRHVISVHDERGLVDLEEYPGVASRLEHHRHVLSRRTCVVRGGNWYRTIDRVYTPAWIPSKLLVPEMMRIPRLAVDRTGLVPSHGIYAIFPGYWPIDALYSVLACGVLGASLALVAPRAGGAAYRCYKRFLAQVPLPPWDSLTEDDRTRLVAAIKQHDARQVTEVVARLYVVDPSDLTVFATESWRERLRMRGGAPVLIGPTDET